MWNGKLREEMAMKTKEEEEATKCWPRNCLTWAMYFRGKSIGTMTKGCENLVSPKHWPSNPPEWWTKHAVWDAAECGPLLELILDEAKNLTSKRSELEYVTK